MLPLRDHCHTVLPGWSTLPTHASYISIRKATRHKLFRSFLLLKSHVQSCCIMVFERMGSICRQTSLGRPSEVTREVKDLVEQQMVRRFKLEIKIPTQQIFAKSKGGLIFKGSII